MGDTCTTVKVKVFASHLNILYCILYIILYWIYWIYHPHPGHHLDWSNSNCKKYIKFKFHKKHIYIYIYIDISNLKCVKHIFMVRETPDATPSHPWVCSDNHKSKNITPKRSFCFTIAINFSKGELHRKKTECDEYIRNLEYSNIQILKYIDALA